MNGSRPATRLLGIADMAQLPAPRFLLDGQIRAEGTTVTYGPSGVGKSLLKVDQSLCITYGKSWWGISVEAGPVVYVAAEGASGLHLRIEAWKEARGVTEDSPDFHVWPAAVNLFRSETQELEAAIARLDRPPVLIVFDTLARCMVGGDENSARDIGLTVDAVDRLRMRFDCAADLLHHTGKNGELERGSSALRGAADTIVALRPEGDGHLKLTCEKQKDGPEFSPWNLRLIPTAESVVLGLETQAASLTGVETQILRSVSEAFETQQFSATGAKDASEKPKASVYRALKSLVRAGLLEEHRVSERRSDYSVTAAGAEKVSAGLRASHETGSPESQCLSPLKGETRDEKGSK